MPDAVYIFNDVVPDGAVDVANIAPGDVLQRAYSFRCNRPPALQGLLQNAAWDFRYVARGYDGILVDGAGNRLAEVNTWQCQVNFTNTDHQPAGQRIVWAIPVSYTVTLTFTETVINDAHILQTVLSGIREGAPDAVLNFQGRISGRN